ncbi:G-protein coupled receptor 84-like [Dreissena polymorpha]|uniref:G-protein coupled receptor 84-like n=1 Tax=Dreissena polymorpha TaxID=45954 RepID=UPI002264C8DB|nr:G-protein coupled receptor 84-like [Dreissena polymorpha]
MSYLMCSNITTLLDNCTHVNVSLTENNTSMINTLNAERFRLLIHAFVYSVFLMIVGIPGNSLVLYVYFVKWKKSTSRIFILFLTTQDLINCLTTIPMELYILRFSIVLDEPWLCKISRFSTFTMNSSSAAILVAIAVDRFRRICRPHGPQFNTKTSKRICIGCVLIGICLYAWPSVIFYGTRTITVGGYVGKSCQIMNQYDGSIFPKIYFLFHICSTAVIFIVLSVLYYLVGLVVYRHKKMRMKRSEERNKVLDMLIKEDRAPHERVKRSDINNTDEIYTTPTTNIRILSTQINDLKHKNSKVDSAIQMKPDYKQRKEITQSDTQTNLKSVISSKLKIGGSTLMLFLITLAYVVSFLPFLVIAVLRQTDSKFLMTLNDAGYAVYQVCLRSYLLSCAINPIIYSFCNAQFRKFCLDVFKSQTNRKV